MDWIDYVIRDLCELPDRSSPEGDPDVIVATVREMRACIVAHAPQMHDGWTLNSAANDVMTERVRQIESEGWTPAHDDEHEKGELAVAAGTYALHAGLCIEGFSMSSKYGPGTPPGPWPWAPEWWKPSGPRRDLVKAAALILAEIERLDRLTPND